MKYKLLISVGFVFLFFVMAPVLAEDALDPSIFIEPVSGGTFEDASGWYAGWVVTASASGTYDLRIYATGAASLFPIYPVYIVVAISDEAQAGGLLSLEINGELIVGFTQGLNPYLPPGGPFTEPDYYGFNDDYQLPGGLTWNAPEIFTVEIVFSPSATEASKVAFLSYGWDNYGDRVRHLAKTPYTGQTMFQVPELATLALTLAFMGALGFYWIKRKRNLGS